MIAYIINLTAAHNSIHLIYTHELVFIVGRTDVDFVYTNVW